MTHTLILKKPKITYRQFCLIQNSWIDLWDTDSEENIIADMHPNLFSKLERVEILENGKEKRTLIWTNEESK